MSAESGGRIGGFELLRAAGAFAVVWIHACDPSKTILRWSAWAAFAVPAFTFVSFHLLQKRACERPESTYASLLGVRLQRIAPAYLAWSAVYIAARLLKHALQGGAPLVSDPFGWIFMGGASYQLYFLPAILYGSAVFLPVIVVAARTRHRRTAGAVMLVLAAALYAAGRFAQPVLAGKGEPFIVRQMVDLAWLVPAASFCALAWPGGFRAGSRTARAAWAAAGCAAFVLAVLDVVPAAARAACIGLGPAIAGMAAASWAVPAVVGKVARISFGIYLCHGLFVEGLQLAAGRLGAPLESAPVTLAVVVLAFLGACALCAPVARARPLRWLVA